MKPLKLKIEVRERAILVSELVPDPICFANVANNLWSAFENEPFIDSNTLLLFTKYLIYKIPRNSYMYKGEWKAIYYRSVLNY